MDFNARDFIMSVIDEATSQFKPVLVVNEDRYNAFGNVVVGAVCDIMKDNECSMLSVDVNDITTDITITFASMEIILENARAKFYELSMCSDSVVFNVVKDEDGEPLVEVKCVMRGVWDSI